jgi:hypothetical protein
MDELRAPAAELEAALAQRDAGITRLRALTWDTAGT